MWPWDFLWQKRLEPISDQSSHNSQRKAPKSAFLTTTPRFSHALKLVRCYYFKTRVQIRWIFLPKTFLIVPDYWIKFQIKHPEGIFLPAFSVSPALVLLVPHTKRRKTGIVKTVVRTVTKEDLFIPHLTHWNLIICMKNLPYFTIFHPFR